MTNHNPKNFVSSMNFVVLNNPVLSGQIPSKTNNPRNQCKSVSKKHKTRKIPPSDYRLATSDFLKISKRTQFFS